MSTAATHREPERGPSQATAALAGVPPRPAQILDAALESGRLAAEPAGNSLAAFLAERSPAAALRLWLGGDAAADRRQLVLKLNRDIAQIDALVNTQVNAILHHPAFQRLEASWRGLRYLVEQAADAEGVKIRILSASWKELARDAERAIEFDQSQLFRKVYSDEFDTPGGQPFAALIGDYQVRPWPTAEHPQDDVAVLTAISHVAAAAFAPFVAGVHPAMFGLDDFGELERPRNLSTIFDQLEYLKWRALRESEDSRFVGLTLPRVLMRLPYQDQGNRPPGFVFHEQVAGPDRGKYLWGNAAYAFGGVLIRCYAESGWLADIRGVQRGVDGGGLVPALPVHCFSTDRTGIVPKSSTEVVIADAQEQELSELGFIALCHCQDSEYSAFYTNQSIQKPRRYDRLAATMNARVSAMLQYMLCVSRFAHYLKVLARDKIGLFTEVSECESYLHDWLQQYVTADNDAAAEVKAQYPLREAAVQVREHPGKPGCYLCVAHLWPHFGLDELVASVRVTTELIPGESR
jgi:type VI secretion system ImpC/EvpB family protein